MKKNFLPLAVVLWLALILISFFIVQKPDFFMVLGGIKHTLLIVIIPAWMALLSASIGAYLLPDEDALERVIFGTAIGLGVFGLAGFGLAFMGWAHTYVLYAILCCMTAYFIYAGKASQLWKDLTNVSRKITSDHNSVPRWIPISGLIACALAFTMSLAPPVEDFDALFYHLTVPAWWLRDGGLTLVALPHYWYPQIVEGSFLWLIAFGVDTSTHLIHLLWLLLTALLLWHWTHQIKGCSAAWDTISILLTMPSLLWLASWAYTDYALTFASLATLYAVWQWRNTSKMRWLFIGGVMAGMAISIKYTGFVASLAGAILVIMWGQGVANRLSKVLYFSITAIAVACPWYIRNWIYMGNPFYPFAFGGRFWDTFMAQAYSAAGSGIGWNPSQILLLPLTATLGTHDVNFFDGRIGPFFLVLSPLAFAGLAQIRQEDHKTQKALWAIGLASMLGIAAWVIGVINSANLFQTRLLFPVLIPMVIPLVLGLSLLPQLDTSMFKVSFVMRVFIAIVVFINLLNFGLQVLVRNPAAVTVGIIPRDRYIEQRQPGYAGALELVKTVPSPAKIYLLFEPRSYGMEANVQPDAINANFTHDVWLYKTSENILAAWKEQGYTHVLISEAGEKFVLQNERLFTPFAKGLIEKVTSSLIKKVTDSLIKIAETPHGDYVLYKIR